MEGFPRHGLSSSDSTSIREEIFKFGFDGMGDIWVIWSSISISIWDYVEVEFETVAGPKVSYCSIVEFLKIFEIFWNYFFEISQNLCKNRFQLEIHFQFFFFIKTLGSFLAEFMWIKLMSILIEADLSQVKIYFKPSKSQLQVKSKSTRNRLGTKSIRSSSHRERTDSRDVQFDECTTFRKRKTKLKFTIYCHNSRSSFNTNFFCWRFN